MTEKLQKRELVTVVCSKNVGHFLKNVEKTYPESVDNAGMIRIIGRGFYRLKEHNPDKIPLFEGDRVVFY